MRFNGHIVPEPGSSVEAHVAFLRKVKYRDVQRAPGDRKDKRVVFQAIGRAKQMASKEQLRSIGRFGR